MGTYVFVREITLEKKILFLIPYCVCMEWGRQYMRVRDSSILRRHGIEAAENAEGEGMAD